MLHCWFLLALRRIWRQHWRLNKGWIWFKRLSSSWRLTLLLVQVGCLDFRYVCFLQFAFGFWYVLCILCLALEFDAFARECWVTLLNKCPYFVHVCEHWFDSLAKLSLVIGGHSPGLCYWVHRETREICYHDAIPFTIMPGCCKVLNILCEGRMIVYDQLQ